MSSSSSTSRQTRQRLRRQTRSKSPGQNEYHVLHNGDAILRGNRNQNWSGFSDHSRGNQDIANCLAAFVLHRLIPINEWLYKHVDFALTVGDQLYQDSWYSSLALPTEGRWNPKLGFRKMLRTVLVKDLEVTLKVYRPGRKHQLNAYNLEKVLGNHFSQEMFGVVSTRNEHVAVFVKNGQYYLFNPQGCNWQGGRCAQGPACVLRFWEIPNLVERFMEYFYMRAEQEFSVTRAIISDIKKRGEAQPLNKPDVGFSIADL